MPPNFPNHIWIVYIFVDIADRPYPNLDDLDGDEELRIEFSCPYCLEEFDVSTLCSHLEDEHCFESKVAVSKPSIHFLDFDFVVCTNEKTSLH